MRHDKTLDMALKYAEKGFNVIPISHGGKIPILSDWVRECSTEPRTLYSWFNDSNSNIGIVTGRVSNIVVIDIDTKGDLDGRRSIADKEAELDSYLPSTVTAQTQSGGLHLFFQYPREETKITGHVGILPQVDIRADGNQVVVYPSIGDKGEYTWIKSPFDTKIAVLPKAWKNFICGIEDDGRIKIPKRPFKLPKTIENGLRHSTLLSYACSLANKGLGVVEVAGAITEANKTICETPIKDETELKNIINWAIERIDKEDEHSFSDLPVWVNVDSKNRKTIDEANFVLWYRKEHSLLYINGLFYINEGAVNPNSIKQDIQNLISEYVDTSLSAKVNGLFESLKNECFMEPPTPQRDIINLSNVSLRVNESGIYEIEPEFTLNRLKVNYDPDAKCPLWMEFLSNLLEEEDIPILQEYIGYCLVPTTVAQKALFLIGRGREGKSVIGEILHAMLGNSMVQGEIHKLQENRFMLAQLENKLVFYDDDLQSQALTDTGTFKKLVTASIPLLVERKGEPHYEMLPYAKILASGNKSIEACYDHSDGFYRRLLLMRCKTRTRKKDDRLFAQKIIDRELSGILNWSLEGLQRLTLNGFEFSYSATVNQFLQDAEEESNSFLAFLHDDDAVIYDDDFQISSKELYEGYQNWCEDNAYTPLAMRTVSHYMKENSMTFGVAYSNKVFKDSKRKRGYVGMRLVSQVEKVSTFRLVKEG